MNNDSARNFLRIQKDSWGNSGSNGGTVTHYLIGLASGLADRIINVHLRIAWIGSICKDELEYHLGQVVCHRCRRLRCYLCV